jgi:hypothetical protein
MADDVKNDGDDMVVDDATDSNLAATTSLGLAAAAHDQNTIFQQNNALQNEYAQQLLEVRRQNVAMFELRMTQANQLFANQISTEQNNRAAATAQGASQAQVNGTNAANQAAIDAQNAHSQALAQQALNVKLSGGVYLP